MGGSSKSPIENIPLEILFEIFGYLSPLDLLVFARLNHTFRQHLMSCDSQLVWQQARRTLNPPCPDPPGWCPEPKWADFFFGGWNKRCQICDKKAHTRPDYRLGRWMCVHCARENLVTRGRIRMIFPENCDLSLLDLVPFTYIGPNSRRSHFKFYWLQDIKNAIAKTGQLKNDVNSGKEGAKEAQDNWLRTKRNTVSPSLQYLVECEIWGRNLASLLSAQKRKELKDRETRWIYEFVNIGYRERDVRAMIRSNNVSLHGKIVNEAAWAKIRAKHESLIIQARIKRLKPIFSANLRKTYEAWFRTRPPQSWYYLPPFKLLCVHQAIVDILKVAETATEDPDSDCFVYLVDRFPEICDRWRKERFEYLRGLVESGKHDEYNGPVNEELVVFQCWNCHAVLFGMKEAAIHCNAYSCSGRVMFCPRTGERVSHLVRLMDKDPLSATPPELDLLDRQFKCLSCVEESKASRRTFTWREMAEHSNFHDDAPEPTETLLELVIDPAEIASTEDTKARQTQSKDWICAHCSEFPYSHLCLTLEVVVSHLLLRHGIIQPIEQLDFLWAFNHPRAWRGNAVDITGNQ